MQRPTIRISNLKAVKGEPPTPSVVARPVTHDGAASDWIGVAPGGSADMRLPDGGAIQVAGVERGAPDLLRPAHHAPVAIPVNLAQALQLAASLTASESHGFGNSAFLSLIDGGLLLQFDDNSSDILLDPSQPYELPTAAQELLWKNAQSLYDAALNACGMLSVASRHGDPGGLIAEALAALDAALVAAGAKRA